MAGTFVAAFAEIGKPLNGYRGALFPLFSCGVMWAIPALRDLLKR